MSYAFKWTKSPAIPYPNVWHRFKAKGLDGEELIDYSIRDIPEDRFEEAIDHLMNNYVHDEPMCASRGNFIPEI